MELTCSRCHQTVQPADCYCPFCGLPQLTYEAETSAAPAQPERWGEPVRDAGTIEWKAALRLILALAIPAGVLSSMLSSVGIFALVLMAATAAWAATLYTRGRRPPWITTGAGARIGLVTGMVGGFAAAAMTGSSLYAKRFWLHQGQVFDNFWQNLVNQQMSQQWASMGENAQTITTLKTWFLSPEGRAGWVLCTMAFLAAGLLLFAVAGGALSARLLARSRRPGK